MIAFQEGRRGLRKRKDLCEICFKKKNRGNFSFLGRPTQQIPIFTDQNYVTWLSQLQGTLEIRLFLDEYIVVMNKTGILLVRKKGWTAIGQIAMCATPWIEFLLRRHISL